MAAAIVGAAIAALVAVVLFVIERSVARHAAFVERRRLAFDDVLLSFASYLSASIEAVDRPAPEYGAHLVTSRARMSLALGKQDRALNWWLNGMERRVGEAAGQLASKGTNALGRMEELNANVSNTLLDIHHGRLTMRDLTFPAAVFFFEATFGPLPPDVKASEALLERPRRDPAVHTFGAGVRRAWLKIARPFRRSAAEEWLPDWARVEADR